jgi:hypothetical protein
MSDTTARVTAILAALPTDDAAFLRGLMAPPWQRRAARLAERDAMVREALAAHACTAPRPAAEALAAELCRAAACPHAKGDRAELLRRIVELSGAKALGWRRIVDIGAVSVVQKKTDTLHKGIAISPP